jgi:hypothetical protein
MWTESSFWLNCPAKMSNTVFKYILEPDAAKGWAVTMCKLVKSSLQHHGPRLFFVCVADRVVWIYEDAGSGGGT